MVNLLLLLIGRLLFLRYRRLLLVQKQYPSGIQPNWSKNGFHPGKFLQALLSASFSW